MNKISHSVKRGLIAFACMAIVYIVIPKLGAYSDMTISAALFAIVHYAEKVFLE